MNPMVQIRITIFLQTILMFRKITLALRHFTLTRAKCLLIIIFSCKEAALEVLISLCLSVCPSVQNWNSAIAPRERNVQRQYTTSVQGKDITSGRDVQGTDITCERNAQDMDITSERSIQGTEVRNVQEMDITTERKTQGLRGHKLQVRGMHRGQPLYERGMNSI